MRVAIDFEFTGLHQHTHPISLGMVAEDGRCFYAEFPIEGTTIEESDFNWLLENVFPKLKFREQDRVNLYRTCKCTYIKHVPAVVGEAVKEWLKDIGEVEIWGDCIAYDWVLFGSLFGHALNIPKNVYYLPFDIHTLFKAKDINPDINRHEFLGITESANHNALYDAGIVMECLKKLTK